MPTQIDESYEVPLPGACPDCGGHKLEQITTVKQYQIEIPPTVIHRDTWHGAFTIAGRLKRQLQRPTETIKSNT